MSRESSSKTRTKRANKIKTTATERVWVAFREYQPTKDAFVNFFSVMLTGSSICHVELILLKKCMGGIKCPWKIKGGACPEQTQQTQHTQLEPQIGRASCRERVFGLV